MWRHFQAFRLGRHAGNCSGEFQPMRLVLVPGDQLRRREGGIAETATSDADAMLEALLVHRPVDRAAAIGAEIEPPATAALRRAQEAAELAGNLDDLCALEIGADP